MLKFIVNRIHGKGAAFGPGVGDDEKIRILNRIIVELEEAIARARQAGFLDLASQLADALAEAERDLAAIGKLQRSA